MQHGGGLVLASAGTVQLGDQDGDQSVNRSIGTIQIG